MKLRIASFTLALFSMVTFAQPKDISLKYNEIMAGKATSVDFDKKYFLENVSVKILPVGNFGSADVYVNGKRVGKVFGIKEKGEVSFDLRIKEATDHILFVGDKDDKGATLKITAISVDVGKAPAEAALPAPAGVAANAPTAVAAAKVYKCSYQYTIVSSGSDPYLKVNYNPTKSSGTTEWHRGNSVREAIINACRACSPNSKVSEIGTSSFRTTTSCTDPVCVDTSGGTVGDGEIAKAHQATLCGNGKAEQHGPVPNSTAANIQLDAEARRNAQLAKSEAETQQRLREIEASRKPIVGTTFQPGPVVHFRNAGISLGGN